MWENIVIPIFYIYPAFQAPLIIETAFSLLYILDSF